MDLFQREVAGDDARFEREIEHVSNALDEVLRAPNGLAALEVLMRYLVATHERFSVQKVGRILEKAAGPRAQEAIVTVLDEIELRGERRGRVEGRAEGRAEGRVEGRVKGRVEGRARTLIELLAVRFGRLPAKVSARILAADEATLTTWTARLLSAPTLEDVIGNGAERASPARRPPTSKRARRV